MNVTHSNDSSTTTNTNHGAFEGMTSLTNVTFASNNVTRIGAQAFKGCSNLATISLPSSVSYIGNKAFEDCNKLNTINLQNVSYIGNSAFKSAFSSIPTSSVELNVEKVNYVGQNAFESTSGLKTINFANNTVLQTVSASAFLNSGITSLDLSQATKLLTISNNAFQGCASLTEVKVPKSLTSFGTGVFGGGSGSNSTATTSLTTIDLSATQVTQLPNSLFQGCSSLSNVKLPAGLTEIGQSAFQGTTSLTTIAIPSTVKRINFGNNDFPGTFQGSGLTSIDLSGTKMVIGGGTDNSNNISWPSNSDDSHCGTFSNMPNLTTVILPANLTGIPKDAFAGSAKLATVKFGAADASNNPSAKDVTGEDNKITLPSKITTIDANAFASTAATAVDLSKITATGFTTINDYVFKDMVSLAEVKLPASITTINQSAFQNDVALKTLSTEEAKAARADEATTPAEGTATFGKSLTSIGQNAFYGTGFTTVDLSKAVGTPASGGSAQTPARTLSVGSGAFTNMAELTTVKLPKDSNINPTYFGNPTTEGTTPKLTSIMYGDGTATATATATIGDATISSPNFSKIQNQTIQINSNTSSTINFTGGVFNGNSTMTKLMLNVTQRNGNTSLWNFNLGMAPTATNTNTDAAYATAPLGNNSALGTIELSGLILNEASASTSNTNQWSRISDTTWAQVASIINMFSSGEVTTNGNTTKANNLDLWTVGSTGAGSTGTGTNSWINTDLTGETVKTGWNITAPSGTPSQGQTLANSTQAATLTHNGVNWQYSNPKGAAAGSTGRQSSGQADNSITITGSGIKIYKAMSGSNGYQTYLAYQGRKYFKQMNLCHYKSYFQI